MSRPEFSIIIPTYNRADFLSKTLESALAQAHDNIEIILSDNASTDNTFETISKYLKDNRIKYFKNKENIGMVSNWRKAVYEYASGDWFLILSDDDYLLDDNYISEAARLIEENKSVVLVYANGYMENVKKGYKKNLSLPFKRVESGKKIFFSRGTILPQDFTLCNVIFNRELSIKFNAFSNKNNISCDSELFLKSCLSGDVGVIKRNVSLYRYNHGTNLLQNYRDNLDMLVNSADCYIGPYFMAIEKNIFTKKELKEWKKRTIISTFLGTLRNVFLYHRSVFLKNIWRVVKINKISYSDLPCIIFVVLNEIRKRIKLLFMLR